MRSRRGGENRSSLPNGSRGRPGATLVRAPTAHAMTDADSPNVSDAPGRTEVGRLIDGYGFDGGEAELDSRQGRREELGAERQSLSADPEEPKAEVDELEGEEFDEMLDGRRGANELEFEIGRLEGGTRRRRRRASGSGRAPASGQCSKPNASACGRNWSTTSVSTPTARSSRSSRRRNGHSTTPTAVSTTAEPGSVPLAGPSPSTDAPFSIVGRSVLGPVRTDSPAFESLRPRLDGKHAVRGRKSFFYTEPPVTVGERLGSGPGNPRPGQGNARPTQPSCASVSIAWL